MEENNKNGNVNNNKNYSDKLTEIDKGSDAPCSSSRLTDQHPASEQQPLDSFLSSLYTGHDIIW